MRSHLIDHEEVLSQEDRVWLEEEARWLSSLANWDAKQAAEFLQDVYLKGYRSERKSS